MIVVCLWGARRGVMRKGASAALGLCLTGLVGMAAAQQAAQQTGNGAADKAPPRLTFDVSSSLNHDDNPDLSIDGSAPRTRLDTRFDLHFNAATRDQSLSFSLQGVARANSGDGLAFRDPSATLAYKLDTGDNRLSFTGLYQQSPVDLFEPVVGVDGGVVTTDILATTGSITTRTAGFSLETGLQRPLGFDLSGNYSGRSYSDTTDPSVYDSTMQGLKAGVHLRMASGGEISLTASSTATDYQNAAKTARDGRDLSLGYSQVLNPALKLQMSLGQSKANTRQNGTLTSTSSGAVGSLGLEEALPNGTASVTLSVTRDAIGPRQALSFGRSLDLPTGKLAATVGISGRSGGAQQLVGNLSYSQVRPSDSLAVTLSRQITLNAADLDVANTVLGLTYQHKINPVSHFGLALNVLATGSGGSAGVADDTRQSLSLTYSQDLAADWQATAGYQVRRLDKSTAGSAESNSIFLTVSRKFTLLP